MAKKKSKWIQKADVKKGAATEAAKREGKSVSAWASEHAHDSGKTGKRARLAKTFKKMSKHKRSRGG
jgi:hypothetical protein